MTLDANNPASLFSVSLSAVLTPLLFPTNNSARTQNTRHCARAMVVAREGNEIFVRVLWQV